MAEEDVLNSFKELSDYDDAARLLSKIYPESLKNSSKNDLASPESFACLLHRKPELFEVVKRGFESRNFDSVWEACERYTQPMKIYHSQSIEDIPGILTGVSSNLRDVVNGRINTPFWRLSSPMSSDFEDTKEGPPAIVKEINLRELMEQTDMPHMLFYELGSFRENPEQYARLQRLFCMGQNIFFVNASATGKTRLLYEGLFEHWGLYVTAYPDESEARALRAVSLMEKFYGEEDMVGELPEASALGYRQLLDSNLKVLDRRFSAVLLVHLLVFREFLKTAHAECVINDEDLRRRWLLVQLSYRYLDKKKDIHLKLLKTLHFEPENSIHAELFKVIENIKPLLPESVITEGLFVAIDEANNAMNEVWRDPDLFAERHPLIKSIIRTWRDRLASFGIPITFIVAGIEIPSEYFPSTSPEWSSWRWSSDTGSFDDKDSQRRFISPFLTPSYAATPSAFYPRSATHEVIFHYILTGKHPPYFGINRLEVVTCAVGQFKDQDMQVIAMDQPGPLIAAAVYLNSGRNREQKSLYSFTAFSSFFEVRWPGGENYPAAAYIAWYIALAFVNGRAMSDVFSIPLPGWLKNSASHAQLVILRKDDRGVVEEMVVEMSALQPTSPPLGYPASTAEDVIAWLNQERTGAFCICPSNCGAELIFVLKLQRKYVWVMLRTVGRSVQPEDIDMQAEFETLTEHNLFSGASPDTTEFEKPLKEALASLPNPLAPTGTFPVLRALASFPTQPPLSLSVAQEAEGGPVAVLKNDTFQTVTESSPRKDLIEVLISSMHDHRLPYANDAFSSIEIGPASEPRKGKRKDSAEEPQEAPSENHFNKASTSSDRLIRSIPRHLSPPSSPTLDAKPGPSSNVAADPVDKASFPPPPPIPKRVKKERNVISMGSNIAKASTSSADIPRRQSPRNAKPQIDGSKELSLTPPDAVPLRRSPRVHKPKKSGGK
ncbi:hypothetical protein H0H87_003131 [Tephrocybe sp. NHM501043]|nr:hypothetical protein H0H87_003131 [Tephrocybe sp. NHM501043]